MGTWCWFSMTVQSSGWCWLSFIYIYIYIYIYILHYYIHSYTYTYNLFSSVFSLNLIIWICFFGFTRPGRPTPCSKLQVETLASSPTGTGYLIEYCHMEGAICLHLPIRPSTKRFGWILGWEPFTWSQMAGGFWFLSGCSLSSDIDFHVQVWWF